MIAAEKRRVRVAMGRFFLDLIAKRRTRKMLTERKLPKKLIRVKKNVRMGVWIVSKKVSTERSMEKERSKRIIPVIKRRLSCLRMFLLFQVKIDKDSDAK